MQNGLYYRFHAKGAPFGAEHATSRNLVSDEDLAGMTPEVAAIVGRTKDGYSSFWNPHHLDQYLDTMGWDSPEETKGRQVIAFHGMPVGEGGDGEPLVMPSSGKIEKRMSLAKFRERLERTPDGFGRWDEHTWGDGPDGRIADDGYRTLMDLGEADSETDFPLALGTEQESALKLGKAPVVPCLYCDKNAKFLVVNHHGVRPACGRHVATAKDDPLATVRLLDPYESKFLTDTKVHIEKPGSKIYNNSTTEQGAPDAGGDMSVEDNDGDGLPG